MSKNTRTVNGKPVAKVGYGDKSRTVQNTAAGQQRNGTKLPALSKNNYNNRSANNYYSDDSDDDYNYGGGGNARRSKSMNNLASNNSNRSSRRTTPAYMRPTKASQGKSQVNLKAAGSRRDSYTDDEGLHHHHRSPHHHNHHDNNHPHHNHNNGGGSHHPSRNVSRLSQRRPQQYDPYDSSDDDRHYTPSRQHRRSTNYQRGVEPYDSGDDRPTAGNKGRYNTDTDDSDYDGHNLKYGKNAGRNARGAAVNNWQKGRRLQRTGSDDTLTQDAYRRLHGYNRSDSVDSLDDTFTGATAANGRYRTKNDYSTSNKAYGNGVAKQGYNNKNSRLPRVRS